MVNSDLKLSSEKHGKIPDRFFAGTKTIPDMASVHKINKNGDFGAISVTERSCAALKVESHISDWLFVSLGRMQDFF